MNQGSEREVQSQYTRPSIIVYEKVFGNPHSDKLI